MQVKTFTKRDIAKIVSRNLNTSIRKSVIYTDEVFNAVRGLLCKDDDYIRVEVRNFGVIESKPAKAKPKARNPRTNEEIFVPNKVRCFSNISPVLYHLITDAC